MARYLLSAASLFLYSISWSQQSQVNNGSSGSGTVTSVTASAPLNSSGGATPNITLTTPLTVPNGGTGVATIGTNAVMIGEGASAIHNVSLTNMQLLVGQTGVDPNPQTLTQGNGIDISSNVTNITWSLDATTSSSFTITGKDATGYSLKTSSGINTGTGCVLFGDGTQQCTRTPLTPSYQYTTSANSGFGFPLVQLSSGDFLVGGYTVAVTTFNADGWSAWPAVATPSPLKTGNFWYGTDNNFHYSPDGTKVLSVLSSTFTAASVAGVSGNVQYNNSGTQAGATLFNVNASSVVVMETFVDTAPFIQGVNSNCGASVDIGPAGTTCANAGNDHNFNPVLIHNSGGVAMNIVDGGDTTELDLGADNSGAYAGTNRGGNSMQLRSGSNIRGLRVGGTQIVTIGRNVGGDAGTQAALYIMNPSTASVGGTMFASMASTNTAANTNEIVFYTFAIPAFTLANAGDCLEAVCGAAGAATATTKQLRIRFNTTTSSSLDGSVIADTGSGVTVNNADLDARVKVCKKASNSQVVIWSDNQAVGTLGVLPPPPSLTATDTAAINVSCTCQNGTANSADCVGKGMTLEYKPAP